MKRLVIADDFSGAAEIAGLARRAGRSVVLLTELPTDSEIPDAEVVLFDTDSRLLDEPQAAARLETLGRIFAVWKPDRIFKKIDSVLRGPVLPEIQALLDAGLAESAVVASANPSRGRVVRNGCYFIEGIPLQKTEFAHDPFHPAACSEVEQIVGESAKIELPDVESENDLQRIVASLGVEMLPVGGADFYRAYENIGYDHDEPPWDPEEGAKLWICGSRANQAGRESLHRSDRTEVIYCDPDVAEERWIDAAIAAFDGGKHCALTLPEELQSQPERLLSFFAGIAAKVVASRSPNTVLIEGGATARSVMNRLGLSAFVVVGEIDQGIVAVRSDDGACPSTFVVKPGSYAWPTRLIA